MASRVAVGVLLLASLMHVGCSSKRAGGPRLATTPLKGIVHVDGVPAEMVTVECHPAPGTSEIKFPVMASTSADGNFAIGMYEKGDGLPEGEYALAFRWVPFGSARKDKLKGAYADPTKSNYKVTVVNGESNDLGIIELSTKGPGK